MMIIKDNVSTIFYEKINHETLKYLLLYIVSQSYSSQGGST